MNPQLPSESDINVRTLANLTARLNHLIRTVESVAADLTTSDDIANRRYGTRLYKAMFSAVTDETGESSE